MLEMCLYAGQPQLEQIQSLFSEFSAFPCLPKDQPFKKPGV